MTRTALALLIAAAMPSTAQASSWQWPLDRHQVARPFRFSAAKPFVPGLHRGVILHSASGAIARAVCTGRIVFAGRVPSGGRGVTISCGALNATEFGLRALGVVRGDTVDAGDAIGVLGREGRLQLGVRERSRRHGYRDPLALLTFSGARPFTLGPAPRGRLFPPPAARIPPARPGPGRGATAGSASWSISALALAAIWGGLGLFGAALGLGITLRVRARAPARRRRVTS